MRYLNSKAYCTGERTVKILDDSKILNLFFERSQTAIFELSEKYGSVCLQIAKNILKNQQDSEECVNDAFLAVWNSVPPNRPVSLQAYVLKTVRNYALKRYHANRAQKRNSHYDIAFEELENCLQTEDDAHGQYTAAELAVAMQTFLSSLDSENRILFVRRYWYGDSVAALAEATGRTPHFISVRLARTREKLKKYLRKEQLL